MMTETVSMAQTRRLSELRPNLLNPRGPVTDADPDLADLVASVQSLGVLQPLTIAPDGTIIAGHRRYAAAKLAGLDAVPVIVADLSPTDQLAAMVVENLHRRNLTPLQTARACAALVAAGMSQRDIARRIGKSEGYISELLKVTRLPATVQVEIERGLLTAHQGMSLARFADRPAVLGRLLNDARRYGLSAEWINSLSDEGERLRITRYQTDEHGVAPDYHKRTRNRPPQIDYSSPDPEDFVGNTSFTDARLAERAEIAEWIKERAPEEATKEARAALFSIAKRIDEGRHAR